MQFAQSFEYRKIFSREGKRVKNVNYFYSYQQKQVIFYVIMSYTPFYPRYQQKITTFVVLIKKNYKEIINLAFVINLQKK